MCQLSKWLKGDVVGAESCAASATWCSRTEELELESTPSPMKSNPTARTHGAPHGALPLALRAALLA